MRSALILLLLCGSAHAASLEDALVPGSITLAVSDFAIPAGNYNLLAKMTFALENHFTSNLHIGVLDLSVIAGPCLATVINNLPIVKDVDKPPTLELFQKGQKVYATMTFDPNSCNGALLKDLKNVPVSMSIVVSSGEETATIPVTLDAVPFRVLN